MLLLGVLVAELTSLLSRDISYAGLMQRRAACYLARLSVVALMFVGGWTAFVFTAPRGGRW